MDEHTTKCDIETGRNKDEFKHIVPPNLKQKQGTSLVESPILLWREIPMSWGTTTDSMTPEINLSQYARTVRKSNTKGYRIVPYFGRFK